MFDTQWLESYVKEDSEPDSMQTWEVAYIINNVST